MRLTSFVAAALLAVVLTAGCLQSPTGLAPTAALLAPTAPPATSTPAFVPLVLITPSAIPSRTPAATVAPTAAPTNPVASPTGQAGCLQPPDDYARVTVNGHTVSRRTQWMLQQAQSLYKGPGSLLWVTQGSYTPGLEESFGTHDGGGAVDIAIVNPSRPAQLLLEEAPKMVAAMRLAGFAAWYRPAGMFGPDSGPHLHAVAIGDADLGPAARRQIDGPEGYLRGLDGLPPEWGGPHADPHGGPVICPWMIKMGFRDLRP